MPDESLITDAMRAALQRQYPPVTGAVTAQEIKRYAYATDDLDPIYLSDEEARRVAVSSRLC